MPYLQYTLNCIMIKNNHKRGTLMGKTIARIYLSHFEHNIQTIQTLAPNKKICLAIKANAYGHGLVAIAQKAHELGIEFLSVATVDEGIELRNAGIRTPILLLSLCHKDELYDVIAYSLTPLVADIEFIDLLYKEFESANRTTFPVHLKIDTGMARHGVQEKDALHLAKHIQSKKGLYIEGTCTHLAVSDSVFNEDILFTKKQIEIFNSIVSLLQRDGISTGILHCAASGGILMHEDSHFDMVRPGILAYGYYPSKDLFDYFEDKTELSFKPVMELISYVTAIKEIEEGQTVSYGRKWKATKNTHIATLSSGYGDGYSRKLSSEVTVTIRNKIFPVVGRICMDQCVIALEKKDDIKKWDEAILFGPHKNCNTALDIANIIDTIPYEVLCAVSARVKRIFIS